MAAEIKAHNEPSQPLPWSRLAIANRRQWHRRELLEGALTDLGVADGNAPEARGVGVADSHTASVRSLTAYRDFDADSDIPILKQAKAGHATLQSFLDERSWTACNCSNQMELEGRLLDPTLSTECRRRVFT